jgi:hypothetical protein
LEVLVLGKIFFASGVELYKGGVRKRCHGWVAAVTVLASHCCHIGDPVPTGTAAISGVLLLPVFIIAQSSLCIMQVLFLSHQCNHGTSQELEVA